MKRVKSVKMTFNEQMFGATIAACRAELGVTGAEAEASLLFERSALYRYERGDENNIKMQNFLSLCNLYDLDPREFFELEK